MIKALVATTAVLIGLTGPQIQPAHAWCMDTPNETAAQCRTRSRIERIEREQQRQLRENTPCVNGWQGGTFTSC